MQRWYLLDTNTVSYIIRGRSRAARTRLAGASTACISSITEAEILYGLARLPKAATLHAAIDIFLLKIPVLPWGSNEARAYGELRARLEAKGKTLGNMDMLIAAHAIALGAVLVTSDKAFAHIGRLAATENWSTDL